MTEKKGTEKEKETQPEPQVEQDVSEKPDAGQKIYDGGPIPKK